MRLDALITLAKSRALFLTIKKTNKLERVKEEGELEYGG